MVETISPVVHGGRTKTYWLSITLHVLGATASAAAFGALLGGAGAFAGAPWGSSGGAYVVAFVALVYGSREAFRLPIPTFDRKQQVPEWWRSFYSKPVAALLYGLGLGMGFATYLTFGTFVAVAFGALVSGSIGWGAIISGTFGFSRALAIAAVTRRSDLDEIAVSSGPRRFNALTLAVLAVTAAVSGF